MQSIRKRIDSVDRSTVRVLVEIKCVLEVIKPYDLTHEGIVDSSLIKLVCWDDMKFKWALPESRLKFQKEEEVSMSYAAGFSTITRSN